MNLTYFTKNDPQFEQTKQQFEKESAQMQQKLEEGPTIEKILIIICKVFFTIFIAYLASILIFTKTYVFTFFDYANVFVHESGHWAFLPFGQFLIVAGGTIFQILIPVAV